MLVAGDARSGKSWVAGLLAEQLILYGYSVCVIDPEGDYRPLQALPGVVALGGADPLPRPHDLLHALQHAESSVVMDLSHVDHAQKVQYTQRSLAGTRDAQNTVPDCPTASSSTRRTIFWTMCQRMNC